MYLELGERLLVTEGPYRGWWAEFVVGGGISLLERATAEELVDALVQQDVDALKLAHVRG